MDYKCIEKLSIPMLYKNTKNDDFYRMLIVVNEFLFCNDYHQTTKHFWVSPFGNFTQHNGALFCDKKEFTSSIKSI